MRLSLSAAVAALALTATVVLWASAFPAIRVGVGGLSVAGLSVARLGVASAALAFTVLPANLGRHMFWTESDPQQAPSDERYSRSVWR